MKPPSAEAAARARRLRRVIGRGGHASVTGVKRWRAVLDGEEVQPPWASNEKRRRRAANKRARASRKRNRAT